MVIDIHTHITRPGWELMLPALGREPFTVETLIARMDLEGIDQSVLLPLCNPENANMYGICGNQGCLEAVKQYPDRLVTFCNVDPRSMMNHSDSNLGQLLEVFKAAGCIGVGEVSANIPIDDPRYINLYRHAGALDLPLLFHVASTLRGQYGAYDSLGLPGFARVLRECPNTRFIGHAPSFWNELDGELIEADRNGYPSGPIKVQGVLWHLFDTYPNLYADTSAGSAYNALSRDSDMGYEFLEKFHDRVFFGTDRFTSQDEPIPRIIGWLSEGVASGKLSQAAYTAIMGENFQRVFFPGHRRRCVAWSGVGTSREC